MSGFAFFLTLLIGVFIVETKGQTLRVASIIVSKKFHFFQVIKNSFYFLLCILVSTIFEIEKFRSPDKHQ